MASCNLGGLHIKLLASYSKFNNGKSYMPKPNGDKISETSSGASVFFSKQKEICNIGHVRRAWRFPAPFVVICSSSQIQSQSVEMSKGGKAASETIRAIPSSQVESLITSICDTTSVTEFKLNLDNFELYVKRDIDGHNLSTLLPTPPPVPVHTPSPVTDSNGSAVPSSLALSRPEPSPAGIQRFIDAALDEELVMIQSPTVGLFRRSRTIKGKRVPPPCKEKQEVKEGQVLCYIEQLGGEIPIESDVAGEVVKILRADGEPVGYGDALIAILPSFPEMKRLQLPS